MMPSVRRAVIVLRNQNQIENNQKKVQTIHLNKIIHKIILNFLPMIKISQQKINRKYPLNIRVINLLKKFFKRHNY